MRSSGVVATTPMRRATARAHASPSATSPCAIMALESPSRLASAPRGRRDAMLCPSSLTRARTPVTTSGPRRGPRPFSSTPSRKRSTAPIRLRVDGDANPYVRCLAARDRRDQRDDVPVGERCVASYENFVLGPAHSVEAPRERRHGDLEVRAQSADRAYIRREGHGLLIFSRKIANRGKIKDLDRHAVHRKGSFYLGWR